MGSAGDSLGSRVVRDGKVLEGEAGWLFLAHDSNDVLAQHTGRLLFSARELEEWRYLLETRRLWLADRGARYGFLVPPNSHTVHADKLPRHPLSDVRPVTQLLDLVDFMPIVYPLEELRAEPRAYFELDTHWSVLGAFIAYQELMEVLGQPALARSELSFSEQVVSGDLGAKTTPPRAGARVLARPRRQSARLLHDNRVEDFGRRVELESDGPDVACLVFGDSYSYAMLPFLAESFHRLLFVQLATMDFELVREWKPDVVVSILNERFLIDIPNDLFGYTARALEAQKVADGRVGMPSVAGLFEPPSPGPSWPFTRRPARAGAPAPAWPCAGSSSSC